MSWNRVSLLLGLATGLLAVVQAAPAGVVSYGDYVGGSVSFRAVEEATPGPGPLFTAPVLVGNQLKFAPLNFASEIVGPGVDTTTSEMSMEISVPANGSITGVSLEEAGDFTLLGLPGADAGASVMAELTWTVIAVNGVSVANGPSGISDMAFTSGSGPHGGEYSLAAGDLGGAIIFSGLATVDITAALASSPYAGQRVTSLALTFGNRLHTSADANASAFIKKKQIDGVTLQVVSVPEPTTWGLLVVLFGLAGNTVMLRRTFG